MKFYDCSTAPSPRRVRIFLAEKGMEIPTVQVDLRNREQLTPEFRRINPWCTVPVLELDDGTFISESVAVCRYLEEIHPAPPLLGVDAADMAVVAMWDHRIEFDGFFAVAECLRNAAPGMAGRALTGPHDIEQIPALAERGRARVEIFYDTLDARLAESEFVAGPRYTMADISALVTVDFAARVKIPLAAGHANVKRWHDAVSQRPSAQV